MNRRTFLAALPGSVFLVALQGRTAGADTSGNDVVDIIFDEVERIIIEEYFGLQNGQGGNGKNKGLPPGLDKRDQLPPELARQIQRNGTLPPGLATRAWQPGPCQVTLSTACRPGTMAPRGSLSVTMSCSSVPARVTFWM